MKLYKTLELTFTGAVPEGSQVQVDLTAVFTCGSERVEVQGFYDGNGVYKVRFLPTQTGLWHWEVRGLITASGEELCEEDAEYPGMVRAEGTHFTHKDGSRYIPFGTTVYALVHQEDTIVEQTLETLKNAPFNKVRMCVFPKHYDLVANEPPCHPFVKSEEGVWDVHKPDFTFWHRFEKYLDRLEELKIQVDLILFHPYDRWGYSSMTQEENLVYLDLVIRRLAARPHIWWSMANEYDLMQGWDLNKWYEIEEYIVQKDPYGHLLSNHNCLAVYDYNRPNITHVCIQTRFVEKAAEWVRQYGKPVVYDEMCYEGNLTFYWGNISGLELVHRFWSVCAVGAYGTHGDTFMDENNIIWWACGGTLKGESAPRIQFLKDILYSLPGPLEPCGFNWLASLVGVSEEKLQELRTTEPGAYLFASGLQKMDPGMRHAIVYSENHMVGHCGEEVYLEYVGRFCPYQKTMNLPAKNTYKIEVIDIWNMTRKVVMTGVSGKVDVPLPAREYQAILATKEQ